MNIERYKQHLEISREGFGALQRVIEFVCCRCGLCVSLCPKQAIEMRDTVPTLTGKCTKCGLCYQGCPRSFYPLHFVKQQWFGSEESEQDRRLGKCVDMFTARSLNDEIFEGATNGGTVTSLLHYLLEQKFVDAVLHVGKTHRSSFICHHSTTLVSTRPENTLRGQHSIQQTAPLLHDLAAVADYPRFAVVGLACHVQALRKLQIIRETPELRTLFAGVAHAADRLVKNLRYVIGVNCFLNGRYGIIDEIYQKFGIREEEVIKFAETSKKSLYQLLHEGKDFFWFGSDAIMTRDGRVHAFRYADFWEQDAVLMGCSVCPSLIVCKEADVSIGITASEIKRREFGYNSVLLRKPELGEIFDRMVQEQKLYRRPIWKKKGRYLRKVVEKMIPSKDMLNFHDYVLTKKWVLKKDIYKYATTGYSGMIMGLERLYLMQTIRSKFFNTPALTALSSAGKLFTENL